MNPSLFSPEGLSGVVFLVMIGLTVAGALLATNAGRLIHAVAGLAISSIGVAGIYYYLNSPFVALMQILIYVGAVCITFVFAIMLAEPHDLCRVAKRNVLVGPLSIIAAGVLIWGLVALARTAAWYRSPVRFNDGSVEALGRALLAKYSMSFELISVVLLVAIIGSLVLARAGRTK